MAGIIIEIITGATVTVISGILLAAYSSNSRKSRKRDKTVFKCLLALLLCQRDGRCNGELESALKELNEYFFEK